MGFIGDEFLKSLCVNLRKYSELGFLAYTTFFD